MTVAISYDGRRSYTGDRHATLAMTAEDREKQTRDYDMSCKSLPYKGYCFSQKPTRKQACLKVKVFDTQ